MTTESMPVHPRSHQTKNHSEKMRNDTMLIKVDMLPVHQSAVNTRFIGTAYRLCKYMSLKHVVCLSLVWPLKTLMGILLHAADSP